MKSVFVDTSAFVALTDKKDKNHARAKTHLKRLARERTPVVTSTYIADEVTNLVRMKTLGLEEAFTFDLRDFGAAGFRAVPGLARAK